MQKKKNHLPGAKVVESIGVAEEGRPLTAGDWLFARLEVGKSRGQSL